MTLFWYVWAGLAWFGLGDLWRRILVIVLALGYIAALLTCGRWVLGDRRSAIEERAAEEFRTRYRDPVTL